MSVLARPPVALDFSNNVTLNPARARKFAAVSPASPPPTTAAFDLITFSLIFLSPENLFSTVITFAAGERLQRYQYRERYRSLLHQRRHLWSHTAHRSPYI